MAKKKDDAEVTPQIYDDGIGMALAHLKAENATLLAENAALKAEVARLTGSVPYEPVPYPKMVEGVIVGDEAEHREKFPHEFK